MQTTHIGGFPVEPPRDNLIEHWVYFVSVFALSRFSFNRYSKFRLPCIFLAKDSSKFYAARRYVRALLAKLGGATSVMLSEEPKRQKVVKALQTAITEFQT
jgi:hypothetical protein